MPKAHLYHFRYEDTGNYRTYYTKGFNKYCFQNDGSHGVDNFVFYRCSKDGEPSYPIQKPEDDAFNKLVLPHSLQRNKVHGTTESS